MKREPKYYEFYGEIVSSNLFLKRLVIFLGVLNLILIYLGFLGFTRPAETFIIRDGYAYAGEVTQDARSLHEVRRFTMEFAAHFLEYNRENFNDRFRTAMKMCTSELEYFMHQAIRNSEIPRIVSNTPGTIRFELADLDIKPGEPFDVRVRGKQVFPGMSNVPIAFSVKIMTVPRSAENPFGLRIINYVQEKE